MLTTIIGGLAILFAVYALAAGSGLFAERSGIINLSINSGMVMGAVGYIMVNKLMFDSVGSLQWYMPVIGVLVGIIFSILITSFLSVASINFKGDQVIVGTALNVIAPIISLLILIGISNGQQFVPTSDYQIITNFNKDIPAYALQLIIMSVVLVVIGFLFYLIRFTTFGRRMRAAGENPHALAAAGVSVAKIRHIAMLISGALAGAAGALVVSSFIKFSSYSSSVFGMGFLALAILILGKWRMQWVLVGAFLFSGIYILAYNYGPTLDDNQWLIYMIPYVAILITLPLISRKSKAPKASGVPYENSGR